MAQNTAAGQQPTGAPGTWPGFAVLLAATATVLMMQATRVFVAYLIFVVDQSRRIELATIALGVFAAIGLAGLLRKATGWQLTIGLTAVVMAGSRLALQFWQSPEARLVLGAVIIICWGWLLTPLLQSQRDRAALGILIGLATDLGIRIAFETVDLPWMPDIRSDAVSVALVISLIVAAALVSNLNPSSSSHSPALSLVAVGPGLAVFHLMTGNLGFAQVRLDVSFPTAASLLALGTVLGLLLSGLAAGVSSNGAGQWRNSPRVEGPLPVAILAIVTILGVWLFWQSPGLSGVALVFGVAGSFVLLGLALLGSEPTRRSVGGSVALWLTIGMLLHAVLLFAYYTETGPQTLIVGAWLLLLIGAFSNGSRPSPAPAWRMASLRGWIGLAAGLLLAVSLQQELMWSEPPVRSPVAGNVTVMTYNIQAGFSRDNIFDLEATARTIEEANPDIVILQEISRGWLVLTGIDQVLWFSQRLDMPFAFGPASDDDLWGNVILTKAPMSDEELRRFTSSQNFRRSAIGVTVETSSGPLRVFATHLDNPTDAGEVRLEQVEQLLAFWNGQSPAVIAGDFNADPESDVIEQMRAAGFDDHGDLSGHATTSEDERRIDYIFTTPDLEVSEVVVADVWTSDHRPVTARMTMRE